MSKIKNNRPKYNPWMLYGSILIFIIMLNVMTKGGGLGINTKVVSLSEFYQRLDNGEVKKVVFSRTTAQVYLTEDVLGKEESRFAKQQNFMNRNDIPNLSVNIGNPELFQQRLEMALREQKIKEFSSEQDSNWGDYLINFLPLIIIIGFWIFMIRRMAGGGGGQFFSIGKSKAKLFDEKKQTKITFNDVAGLEGAKEEIQEIVEFLKNPEKYTSIGGKIPKGALLVGPPGTGKTLLAKAVAGEAEVPFFSLSGSDFVEMFVGVGASRVRDLFRQAKDRSPAIIFIDEIDAIGRARGKSNFSGSNDERENTLNQLLTEMDGFGTNTNVIVLAATNRAEILDKALMRAGRFDRQIYVDLPDSNERKQIFEV